MTSEYTTLDQMRHSDGRDGRSPVAELKLIKYNAFADGDYIDQVIHSQGNSFIKGKVQMELFSIMKYEMLFAWSLKSQWRTAQVGEETSLRVFSVLNGLGRPDDTKMKLLNRIRFVGFAGTGTREDSTNQSVQRSLPTVMGGLYNAWNTGESVINAGDWVYWDMPKNHKEIEEIQGSNFNKGRPRERYLGILRPYAPKHQVMNVEMLRYANVDHPSSAPHSNDSENEIMQWAQVHAQTLRMAMYLGALMASSGVFGDLPALAALPPARTDDDWIKFMQNRMNSKGFQEFSLRVAHDLAITTNGRPKDWQTKRVANKSDPQMVANRLLFPTTNKDRIVARTAVRADRDTLAEPQRVLAHIQESLAKDNLRAGEEVRYFTKGRIVGKAMQDVAPGDFFDILIGSYEI